MDKQYTETEGQRSDFSPKVHISVSEEVQNYRRLESAVSHGQTDLIESLLEAGTPVNGHPVCYLLRTPLHSSIHLGNPKIVEKLLSKGANVDAKYSGDTPLTLAAKLEKFEIVDILLLHATGLKNSINGEQISHLHIACMRNRVDLVKKFLQCEQDVDATVCSDSLYWPGFTPLHFAVQFGHLEAVEFLLHVGADVTVKDARQFTPLHLAHTLKNEQIVRMILFLHDRIVNNPVDSRGLSHFDIACIWNDQKIVEHFIHMGVNLQDPDQSPFKARPKTAIDLAIQYECVDIVKLLLEHGAYESSRDEDEFDRIKNAYCTGNMKIVDLLIGESELGRKVKKFESNYLALATSGCDEALEKWITETPNASKLPITSTHGTMLHLAIKNKNHAVCKFLVDKGAKYWIKDMQGDSSLHLAFERDMNDLVDLILEKHNDSLKNIISQGYRVYPNIVVDNDGLSNLHIACARNSADTVKHLLQLGADVNSPVNLSATFRAGYTPLHFAAEFGCEKVAYVLLKHGAKYSAMDKSNRSAFDVAFTKANETSNSGAFNCMKLILISHSKRKDEQFNDRGVSLLHLASIKVKSYSTPLGELGQLLDKHPGDVNKTIHKMNSSWDGYTPLHFAVQHDGESGHAKLLIMVGADVLRQDSNGDTALHLATSSMVFPDKKFDPRDTRYLDLNHIGTRGLSIFHVACNQGNLDLMKFYLERGIDANCASLNKGLGCDDSTPLHLAVQSSKQRVVDTVKLLLEHDADPNVRDLQGNAPVHLTHYCYGHPAIIDLLVSHGADVDARNIFLDTPLICLFRQMEDAPYMCSHYYSLIVSLIDNGANIDLTNKRGVTVFSVAYSLGNLDPSDESDFQGVIDVIDILLRQVIALETLGIYMSERNRDFYSSLLSAYSDDLSFEKNTAIQACSNEFELMKHIRIDNSTSFCDILLGSPNKLATASQKRTFQNMVNSNDFCDKYPVYGSMIKLRLKQGQMRWRLLNDSVESLDSVLGITLPQICSNVILQHLDNQDLRNIITSAKYPS